MAKIERKSLRSRLNLRTFTFDEERDSYLKTAGCERRHLSKCGGAADIGQDRPAVTIHWQSRVANYDHFYDVEEAPGAGRRQKRRSQAQVHSASQGSSLPEFAGCKHAYSCAGEAIQDLHEVRRRPQCLPLGVMDRRAASFPNRSQGSSGLDQVPTAKAWRLRGAACTLSIAFKFGDCQPKGWTIPGHQEDVCELLQQSQRHAVRGQV